MTREQAINYLISSGFTQEQVCEVVRALTYAPTTKNNCAEQNGCITCSLDDGDDCCRKLYEESMQEPTTKNDLGVDCISRDDVWEVMQELWGTSGELLDRLMALPSVTPQEPKTGHWIEHPEIETSTPEYLMFYECSECGNQQCFYKEDTHRRNYCGNCGARMVEPQERSGEE